MIDIINQTDLSFDTQTIEAIAKDLLAQHKIHKSIELLISDNDYIQSLNCRHRGKNSNTDVLSFPMHSSDPGSPLGSIVISNEYVQRLANDLGHTAQQELALLFTHGLLHLLGYDHEIDNNSMREKEKEIIIKYQLPNSLILRNQDIQ